mmetsp:Transcript_63471/g.105583  ORF Transcript_63471/g.105583 Transcript_63471/m.105583 type:complete len:229 (-) Transcript_63471:341-1027(-)
MLLLIVSPGLKSSISTPPSWPPSVFAAETCGDLKAKYMSHEHQCCAGELEKPLAKDCTFTEEFYRDNESGKELSGSCTDQGGTQTKALDFSPDSEVMTFADCKRRCCGTTFCTGIEWEAECTLFSADANITGGDRNDGWEDDKVCGSLSGDMRWPGYCIDAKENEPDSEFKVTKFEQKVYSEWHCKDMCNQTSDCAYWEFDADECEMSFGPIHGVEPKSDDQCFKIIR